MTDTDTDHDVASHDAAQRSERKSQPSPPPAKGNGNGEKTREQEQEATEREARKKNRAALTEAIEESLKEKSAMVWEEAFNKAGIPAGRVLSVPEALTLPNTKHWHLLRNIEGTKGLDRAITVMGGGFIVSDCDNDVRYPPPALGEHTDEILAGLGYSTGEIGDIHARGDV